MQRLDKILVIQTAFLGDVVLATGILEKLHTHYPDSEIHFLIRKGNQKVLQGHPFIKRLWVFDKSKKIKSLFELIREIRKEKFDLVVNLHRFLSTGLLTTLSRSKQKIGFRKNPLSSFFDRAIEHVIDASGNSPHEIARNQLLIADITDEQPAKPRLYPTKHDINEAEPYKRATPYLCIAPASIWFTKQWPIDKWVSFIRKISSSFTVYILGAPNDHAIGQMIIKKTEGKKVINLAGKLTPLASTELMKGAVMNYANDSAPLHFASAINAPITAIYCSTVPAFGFYPLADNSTIIENKSVLECRPCGLHGHKECPKGHFNCALQIDPEQLLATLP